MQTLHNIHHITHSIIAAKQSAGSELATTETSESEIARPRFVPQVHQWPRIFVRSGRVYCDGRVLDLARRPLMLKLFQVFCRNPNHEVGRHELVDEVYGEFELGARSSRLRESLHHNIVKLLSRARRLAEKNFGGKGMPFEWFLYQPQRQVWQLFRLKNEFSLWLVPDMSRQGDGGHGRRLSQHNVKS